MTDTIKLSRFLSFVLRHKPEAIGVTIQPEGWIDIDQLISKSAAAGNPFTRNMLSDIVKTDGKGRYTISEDGRFVRANQGHSVNVSITMAQVAPPDTLYHGTSTKNQQAIEHSGLSKMKRQHVHLSPDTDTATTVGNRHGKLVIFSVDAKSMHKDGFTFYRSDNGVWLTDTVPARYLCKLDIT